ncbi:hypothetical protein [Actinomycetospora atypica]|uniref:RNA-binding S4 domain-containing protein n=1 Tax=Actinomycetospora atypica TaxID=1290095 RepID=A0ABV9YJB1_9PSEU
MTGLIDEHKPVTVFDRLVKAGISGERAQWWLAQGGVRVDDEPVTDPITPAELPAHVVLRS